MNDATYIIKRPIINEKSAWESERHNRYSFVVDRDADKPEIQAAIEALYSVRVARVRTQIRKGKYVRTKFGAGVSSTWKKAIVELHEDDRIDLF